MIVRAPLPRRYGRSRHLWRLRRLEARAALGDLRRGYGWSFGSRAPC
jgi:hypothetical protein